VKNWWNAVKLELVLQLIIIKPSTKFQVNMLKGLGRKGWKTTGGTDRRSANVSSPPVNEHGVFIYCHKFSSWWLHTLRWCDHIMIIAEFLNKISLQTLNVSIKWTFTATPPWHRWRNSIMTISLMWGQVSPKNLFLMNRSTSHPVIITPASYDLIRCIRRYRYHPGF